MSIAANFKWLKVHLCILFNTVNKGIGKKEIYQQ